MYKIIVGNISDARRANWFSKDENPYAVWKGKALVEESCIGSVWVTADEILRDRVDIDWGSIAWKANKDELLRFFHAIKSNTTKLIKLDSATDYAVVFIENVWGASL